MPKTSNIFARVDPKLKKEAEAVLEEIGLPMSNAINLFLKQLVLRRGIPFPVTLPSTIPPAIDSMSKEQFDRELEKGYLDMVEGRVKPAKEVIRNYDTNPAATLTNAFKALQEESIQNGTSEMTMEDIDAEIAAYRQEKRSKK